MSIECVSWALKVPIGGNPKVILLGLANHAHPDGTDAYPALDTLAEYAACDRSTARRNVRKLVEMGWIIDDGTGPRGQTKYRLALEKPIPPRGGAKVRPVAPAPGSGGSSAPEGVAPVLPEPSIEPSTEQSTTGTRAPANEIVHRLPDDLPEALHDVAIEAGRILHRAAKARGQTRVVMLEAVGRAVGANPTKDHVYVAGRVEHWLCWGNGQGKPCKDIVGRFGDWLPDSPDIRLPDGSPLNANGSSPGVTPLFGGRKLSNDEKVDANIRALRSAGGSQDVLG